MHALIKHPNAKAERCTLPDDEKARLRAMQSAVGGYIEIAIRGRNFVVWCDEEGHIKPEPAPINFYRPTDQHPIVGTVLLTLVDDNRDPIDMSEDMAVRLAAVLDRYAARGELCGLDIRDHEDPTENGLQK